MNIVGTYIGEEVPSVHQIHRGSCGLENIKITEIEMEKDPGAEGWG